MIGPRLGSSSSEADLGGEVMVLSDDQLWLSALRCIMRRSTVTIV
jgi:hypothetical protein